MSVCDTWRVHAGEEARQIVYPICRRDFGTYVSICSAEYELCAHKLQAIARAYAYVCARIQSYRLFPSFYMDTVFFLSRICSEHIYRVKVVCEYYYTVFDCFICVLIQLITFKKLMFPWTVL